MKKMTEHSYGMGSVTAEWLPKGEMHFNILVVFAFTPLAERHPNLETGYMCFLLLLYYTV